MILLGQTDVTDYRTGSHHFRFSVDVGPCLKGNLLNLFKVDEVNVGGIKPSRLTNAGLLTATLKSGTDDVIDVNMVVQVASDRGGPLTRCIFNPLD